MSSPIIYKRILLKISGEALNASGNTTYANEAVNKVADRIIEAHNDGIEVAVVVGAGNIWRGAKGAADGMDRVTADYMGMLATVMNALCIKEVLTRRGVAAHLHSSVDMRPFAQKFDRDEAMKQLSKGEIVIFGGGTSSPYFTTDTAAALRALETSCQAVVKATKVNGIYTADPKKDPTAKKFDRLSFKEAIEGHYKVMDASAFALCSDNNLHIIVFNFDEPGALKKIVTGDYSAGTIVS